MTLEEAKKNLEIYKRYNNSKELNEFEKSINFILTNLQLDSIAVLINYLDDNCESIDMMYSIIHAVESFDDEQYVINILKSLEVLIKKSPIWCECIFNRLFNSNNTLKLFRIYMHFALKKSLLELFEIMRRESPHHSQLIKELIQQLETS